MMKPAINNDKPEITALTPETMESKYINLMTDYGPKSVLKVAELAVAFLNDVLTPASPIKSITHLDKEITGKHKYHRTAIFDLLCKDEQGKEFIVEIQRGFQQFFFDRAAYYASARIVDNAPKGKAFGKWDYQQKPLVFIGILGAKLKGGDPNKFKYIGQISDIQDNTVLYDKLTFIILDLATFEELVEAKRLQKSPNLYKWLYAIRELHNLKDAPQFLKKGAFNKLLEVAEISNMTKDHKHEYELSLKRLRDEYAIRKTEFNEGKAEGEAIGRKKEKIEFIKKLLKMGSMNFAQMAEIAGVDEAFVLELKDDIKSNDAE